MNASALVVLRCCGSDVPPFAVRLAVALRVARPHRHVLVEADDGDVMWRPPDHAPTVAVRLVLVCGEELDTARLQAPNATRPVHVTAVVVSPGGHDPGQPASAAALPRIFADVVGVAGAAAMLHGILDGEELEEGRDTEEWLAPDDDGFGAPAFEDDGTVPPWPTMPEGASGLDAFRGPVPAAPERPVTPAPVPASAPRIDTMDSAVREFVVPAPSAEATVIVSAHPVPAPAPPPVVPPIEPPPPPPRATTSEPPPPPVPSASAIRRRTASKAPPAPAAPLPAPPAKSPAAKVAKGLKRIAGAVEDLAASVVNDWILRAPAETSEAADGTTPSPAAPPPPAPDMAGAPRAPVALGASAPRTAAPGGEFTARFIAHVPGRERAVAARLNDLSPEARVHVNVKPCQWAPGTAVTVRLRARGLEVEPPARTFTWQGDEHVEEFDVTVPADAAPGTLVLTFDAAIDGIVVATLRVDLVVTADAGARKARTSATATAARTAFASYATADRARVLDRIAALQISAGLDVFVDCLSLHPGEASQNRLAEEIRAREVFLLFWSASAAVSSDVAWEYRTAIEARGVEAVQLHPLEPDVRPPAELADQHAGT